MGVMRSSYSLEVSEKRGRARSHQGWPASPPRGEVLALKPIKKMGPALLLLYLKLALKLYHFLKHPTPGQPRHMVIHSSSPSLVLIQTCAGLSVLGHKVKPNRNSALKKRPASEERRKTDRHEKSQGRPSPVPRHAECIRQLLLASPILCLLHQEARPWRARGREQRAKGYGMGLGIRLYLGWNPSSIPS